MEIAFAYGVFYRALHTALLSNATPQERLAGLVFGVKHLKTGNIPDEQISKRYAEFVQSTSHRALEDGSVESEFSEEDTASYLEQALSLFGAIAIAYGQHDDHAETSSCDREQ